MENIICWILIGICCFYLIRNFLAGYVLYPLTNQMITMYDNQLPRDVRKAIRARYARRNYYLFVLNPFWWTVVDVFKNKTVRKEICDMAKNLRNFK